MAVRNVELFEGTSHGTGAVPLAKGILRFKDKVLITNVPLSILGGSSYHVTVAPETGGQLVTRGCQLLGVAKRRNATGAKANAGLFELDLPAPDFHDPTEEELDQSWEAPNLALDDEEEPPPYPPYYDDGGVNAPIRWCKIFSRC